jgi:hypothetical protein
VGQAYRGEEEIEWRPAPSSEAGHRSKGGKERTIRFSFYLLRCIITF